MKTVISLIIFTLWSLCVFAEGKPTYNEIEYWFETHQDKIPALCAGDLPENECPAEWNPILTEDFCAEIAALIVLNEQNGNKWSDWEIAAQAYWNVLSGTVHFMLDVAGMAPVVGEVADIVNGGIYLLEGDEVSAGISFVAAVPLAGMIATGAKWMGKVVKLSNGKKIFLNFTRRADGLIDFGSPNQLGKILKTNGATLQAHHLIPWALKDNPVLQKAAEAGFHLNDELNGVLLKPYSKELGNGVHGNHPAYSKFVENMFNKIKNKQQLTPEQAKAFIEKELIPLLQIEINKAISSGLSLNQHFKSLL